MPIVRAVKTVTIHRRSRFEMAGDPGVAGDPDDDGDETELDDPDAWRDYCDDPYGDEDD